ncbi:Pyridoxamine 5'-phosphate oxidase [compost metagenome]
MNALTVPSDPLTDNVRKNGEIGLLAIDLERRIRLRINGTAAFGADHRLIVNTEQVYGNCPKYIQKRILPSEEPYARSEKSVLRGTTLRPAEQKWIATSDTFFIASANSQGKADASHRGGMPGFVSVVNEKVIVFPDYYGNSMFNTLGNIYDNPNTGLLFIDFLKGHTLQLSGRSEIIWDEQEIQQFPGAERLVRFEVEHVLNVENSSLLSWKFLEFSPANPSL